MTEVNVSGPDPAHLRDAIRAALAGEADVELAYLFGSCARSEGRSDSDADVAVGLVHPTDPVDRLFRLGTIEDRLRTALGRPVDVVDLYRAPPLLAHEVLRDGRPPVLVRDEPAWLAFEAQARRRWFELKRRHDQYLAEAFR